MVIILFSRNRMPHCFYCPRCAIKTTLKTDMRKHFNRRKMCQPRVSNIWLTKEIKERVLSKTYKPSPTHINEDHSPKTINIVNNNTVNQIINIFELPCGKFVQCLDSKNACGLNENTRRFLKSRNVMNDCDKLSFEVPEDTALKLKDIKTYIIGQLKEYETYLIRGMYSNSASLKEKEEAKAYLVRLFKFYFAFDTKPYVNHIIFPKGFSHDFEFVQIFDLYAVSKTIMNIYEDVCDGMSARELRDLENCIDNSITDNSRKNMEDLQEKILNLLGTDPNFNIKMLNAQCDN